MHPYLIETLMKERQRDIERDFKRIHLARAVRASRKDERPRLGGVKGFLRRMVGLGSAGHAVHGEGHNREMGPAPVRDRSRPSTPSPSGEPAAGNRWFGTWTRGLGV